jgi:hypothetical protein
VQATATAQEFAEHAKLSIRHLELHRSIEHTEI